MFRSVKKWFRSFKVVTFMVLLSIILTGPCSVVAEQKLILSAKASELEETLELVLDLMLDEKLYKELNDFFIAKAKEKNIEIQNGFILSETKLVFLLYHLGIKRQEIRGFLNSTEVNLSPKTLNFPNQFRSESRLKNPEGSSVIASKVGEYLLQHLTTKDFEKVLSFEVYSQPLILKEIYENLTLKRITKKNGSKNDSGFQSMELFINHPYYDIDELSFNENLKPKSKIIKGDNHKQIMIDLVSEARNGDRLYFNFYDFDINELALAFVQAKIKGVQIIGGIDLDVYNSKPNSKAAIDLMIESGIQIEKVDSVGLNHQKIIVLQSKDRPSKTLFSSGNATQSCSAKEGDLKDVPEILRPNTILTNPNNMVLMSGDLPAVIALSEIKKNVIKKLRGQSEFPISGAYQLFAEEILDKEGKPFRESVLMAFSPNGGHGHIGNDIFSKLFSSGKDVFGVFEGAFFSFSSKSNLDQLLNSLLNIVKERKDKGLPAKDIFNFVGDNQFALREFSNLLTLSGYKLIEFDPNDPFKDPKSLKSDDKSDPQIVIDNPNLVKVYVEDNSNEALNEIKKLLTKDEWKNWLDNIRVTDKDLIQGKVVFQDKEYPWSVKLHDKLLSLPELFLSTVGSSMNFSSAGEANQEQILIVYSKRFAKKVHGAIRYLFDQVAGTRNSVDKEVQRRNRFLSLELRKKAIQVEAYRAQLEKNKIMLTQCLKRYSKSVGK